jgi:hypothetical protein
MSTTNYLADVLKSLAQPTRFKIIDFLREATAIVRREVEVRSDLINGAERG